MTKFKIFNEDHLLSFIWLLLLILPNNQMFFLFVPLSFLILTRMKNDIKLNITPFIFLFISLLLITILMNAGERYSDFKSITRAFILIFMFICFGKLKGNKILAPYIYFSIAYLVISQFTYVINIGPLKTFFTSFYPYEGDKNVYSSDFYESYEMSNYGILRLGGIYFNPNQYARYLELIMVVFLCEIKQFSKRGIIIVSCVIVFFIVSNREPYFFNCIMRFHSLLFLHHKKTFSC